MISQETLSVSGVLLSRSFGRGREEIARFRRLTTHLAQLQVRQQMIGQGFLVALRVFFTVLPVLAYLVAGLLLDGGGTGMALRAGTLVAFTAVQMQLYSPVAALVQTAVQVQASLALFERIFAYLDLHPEITDAPDAIALPPGQVRGAISLRGVCLRYPSAEGCGPARCALTDLSLDIAAGRLAAIVGASGSGKTTLSYLLTRLYDVTTGAVLN